MGEIADMMLEGDLCAACGSYIDDEGGDGFPRYCCRQCAIDAGAIDAGAIEPAAAKPPKVKCPTCGRKVSAVGLKDHQRDAHGSAQGKSGEQG